jgi:glutamyl-tRNA synthetase
MSENRKPVLRFAPSPTGMLHIGGARTALFNWLYARHTGGTFLLRVEDTDRERSTPEAVNAILHGLEWLGLTWDGPVIYQFARADRHRAVAEQLLRDGKAYRCYATADELTAMRQAQKAAGQPMRYDGRWRDRDPAEAPPGAPFVVRLRSARNGETVVHDAILGDVHYANDQMDDMVLLRSDGTPTYMLAVVVDDHDMGVTHVIRGSDHLNNAARQLQIIRALDWSIPVYGHLPLINGPMARNFPSAMARSASRPIAIWATCPKPCATIFCAWAGVTAMKKSSPRSRPLPGSISPMSAKAPRGWISRSSTI